MRLPPVMGLVIEDMQERELQLLLVSSGLLMVW